MTPSKHHWIVLCWIAWLASSAWAADRPTVDSGQDLAQRARGILSNRCFACHGPDEGQRESGLRLDRPEGLVAPADSGLAAVVPGDPQASELWRRIATADASERMPPAEFGQPLTEGEIEVLRRWIAGGAQLPRHWAYVPPRRPSLPDGDELPRRVPPGVDLASWLAHPLDRFVLAALQRRGMVPSPPATRAELLRRVALDLTGLPPTLEQIDAFERDHSPEAYERAVERLLASPAYGEHWGAKWLDLARYADSAGYADDPPRTIWAYRDWVIDAFNANQSIDQFTIEQLAGDLLPEPTVDQLIATAFHRNTMTNNEGGTNDEEFRNAAIVDRVNTTMATWMGTTMACAQCHTHKYDPFTQTEYFQLFAIFNQTADADRRDESPTIPVFSRPQQIERQRWQRRIEELQRTLQTPSPEVIAELDRWHARFAPPHFHALQPSQATGAASLREDGTLCISAGGTSPVDAFPPASVEFSSNSLGDEPITALRLTALPFPGTHDPGAVQHPPAGLILEEAEALVLAPPDTRPAGRYVRVELPGRDKFLSLAEVQVYVGGRNVARQGTATQSSTDYGGGPERAIDGNTSGDYDDGSVTHTARSTDPWWELDLGAELPIERIVLWNRTGGGIHTRLDDARVRVLDGQRRDVFLHKLEQAPTSHATLEVAPIKPLRFSLAVASAGAPSVLQRPADTGADTGPGDDAQGGPDGSPPNTGAILLAFDPPIGALSKERLRLVLHLAPGQRSAAGASRYAVRIEATTAASVSSWLSMDDALREVSARPAASWTPDERCRMSVWFAHHRSTTTEPLRRELEQLRQRIAEQKPETTVPVLQAIATPRPTFVQIRGNYKVLGQRVEPGTPAALHPLPTSSSGVDRLALAHWIVDRHNPLTARVWVNRLWESLFGRGIVETSEEFGSQGSRPTHPELLDWMAVELMESGWDQKRMLRWIVTSQTYRQSSRVTAEQLQRDKDNVWLARGPRVRLSAEMVRDQALSAGGLLSRKMYGPPTRPPQPELGLKAAFGSATDWQPSGGEDRYRRAIYTLWRRSNPYPSLAMFDAPSREVCTVRRDRTNTPLQALVTMNDPCFVEAAQGLARLVVLHQPELTTDRQRLELAFERCTGRRPLPVECEPLQELLDQARVYFAADPEAAQRMASDPLGPLPDGADPVDLAAFTTVGNVLLNLDEVLMKR